MNADDRALLADALELALVLHPDTDRAATVLARAITELGHPAAALRRLDQHVARQPADATAWLDRAQAQRAQGDREGALSSVDRALALAPDRSDALANRTLLLRELRRWNEVHASLQHQLSVDPDNARALADDGQALLSLGRPDDALRPFDRAIALQPDLADAHAGRATAMNELDRLHEALTSLQRLREIGAADAGTAWNEALIHLALGDFRRGLPRFEERWNLTAAISNRPNFQPPLWLGETPVAGRTILLVSEQGLGDSLQFCRYAPMLARRGATVLLSVPRPLVRLMRTLDGVSRVMAEDETPPPFDVYCPLMSLPLAFDTVLETIPGDTPYLHADPAAVAAWHARLEAHPGLRVGLVWAGNPRPDEPDLHAIDGRRSLSLSQFTPLAAIPGVTIISLQKINAGAQVQPPSPGLSLIDWTDELTDFADTAALVAALDLVISVDTSVVHLTGALGKPVWILDRFAGCWRWLRSRADSPWYPTARLFRQSVRTDWRPVIAAITGALAVHAAARADAR